MVWQDLPEYFEDCMKEWMRQFSKLMQYKNIILIDNEEEEEADVISKVQASIIEILHLFVDKDEEVFTPFLAPFTTCVWNRLMALSPMPKDDVLATRSIKYLSVLISKMIHKNLFQEETTLRQIVEKIIIPNIEIRQVDE